MPIIDKTKEGAGMGYQILSGVLPKQHKNIKSGTPLHSYVVFGFLFRVFIIVFLFLYGIEIITINNKTTETFRMWWLVKLMGAFLVFLSLYLLQNTYSKKINEEVYVKWAGALLIVVIILLLSLLSGDLTIKDLIKTLSIAF